MIKGQFIAYVFKQMAHRGTDSESCLLVRLYMCMHDKS